MKTIVVWRWFLSMMKIGGLNMIQFKNDHFTVFQSVLYKTTSVVVQTEDLILIVDPNLLPNEVKLIRDYVNELKGNRPVYIIFTHSDWDHIVGYGAFLDANVIASNLFEERNDKENILKQIHEFDDQYYIDRDYPILYPSVDLTIKQDGQIVKIGNTTLTFYLTAGHTNDGLYTIVEPLGIWIAGDYLSDFEFPFIYTSSYAYEKTLNKTDEILSKHNIKYLIPGHGMIAKTNEEILFRKENALHYIKELRSTLKTNGETQQFINNYKYKNGQFESHEGNIELIKKEFK